jgi:hypothetical protein
VQPSLAYPVLDRFRTEPEIKEIAAREHAVLRPS